MTSLPNCNEVDDAKLTNTQDIANAFNSHFSAFAKNLLAQNQPSQSSSTTSFANFNNYSIFFINPITAQEIKRIIHIIKPKSSSGCDGIPFNFCMSYLNLFWQSWPTFLTSLSIQENFLEV